MIREKQIQLRDPETEPTHDVLNNVLGSEVFAIYDELTNHIFPQLELNPEWRFYKDGKAWLCKVIYKKKTVCWLSVWDRFIKIGFYFTEKTRSGIDGLAINEKIKKKFDEAKAVGKLIPLILDIDKKEQLKDLKEILLYKKALK